MARLWLCALLCVEGGGGGYLGGNNNQVKHGQVPATDVDLVLEVEHGEVSVWRRARGPRRLPLVAQEPQAQAPAAYESTVPRREARAAADSTA